MSKNVESEKSSISALADWIDGVALSVVSTRALQQAKLLVLDTIGCAIAGLNEPVSRSILELVDDLGGRATCSIVGRTEGSSVLNAVLANGACARVLDLNDYIGGEPGGGPEIGGHPSDNIPVALAVGEAAGRSGVDVLVAIVLAYEIFGRMKRLMNPVGVWDEVSISGLVAPAITGRLMRLGAHRIGHGLALGAARAATPAIVRGGHLSAAKSIANALVAQSGLQGALLAARGVTGPLAVLDSARGIHELFAAGDAAAILSAPMPERPYILRSNIKMYPCLATGQSAVAAALALREKVGGDVGRLQRIEIVMADYPIVKRQQQDLARTRPQSREAADHSFTFLVATALLDGEFGLSQYDGERWRDPAVTALIERMTMSTDQGWSARAIGSYPCALRARDDQGTEYVAEVPYPPGFAKDGLQAADVVDKFKSITKRALSSAQQDQLVAAALGLDQAEDLGALTACLRAARSIA